MHPSRDVIIITTYPAKFKCPRQRLFSPLSTSFRRDERLTRRYGNQGGSYGADDLTQLENMEIHDTSATAAEQTQGATILDTM